MISMLYNEAGDFLFLFLFLFHLTAEMASLVSLKGQHAVLLLQMGFYVLLHRMLGLAYKTQVSAFVASSLPFMSTL